ncbi:hypothetical protein Poly41_56440 [Novipirellula artificiosorum]|uniref:Uncharacterized protein n=1 Tax=Novipirellula artificiosorum TaxID=2528016 RepID=A0A5C6DB93_9BACT|nr:hypothetical protein Poly41_56440 [Novipirellula artificiosorum]
MAQVQHQRGSSIEDNSRRPAKSPVELHTKPTRQCMQNAGVMWYNEPEREGLFEVLRPRGTQEEVARVSRLRYRYR